MTPNEWAHVTMRVLNLTTTTQAGARMLQVIEKAITKAIAEALKEKNTQRSRPPFEHAKRSGKVAGTEGFPLHP